jgi:hypothetical protein
MSVPDINDPWNEVKERAKKLGFGPQEIQQLMYGPKQRVQTTVPTTPSPTTPENPMRQRMRDMVDTMLEMNMWRSMGFLNPNNDSQKANNDQQLAQMIQQIQQNPNKFNKDDMMMIMMLKMIGNNGEKNGLQMNDMIQLMTMMNQKGTTIQDYIAFLTEMENKKKEGLQEGQQIMERIYTNPKPETFDDFVNARTREALKNKVADAIDGIFANPTQAGIMNDKNQIDWGKLADRAIKTVQTALEKQPSPQAPPQQSVEAESPPPSMESESTPTVQAQPALPPDSSSEPLEVQ